jgi:hypothetical protein
VEGTDCLESVCTIFAARGSALIPHYVSGKLIMVTKGSAYLT